MATLLTSFIAPPNSSSHPAVAALDALASPYSSFGELISAHQSLLQKISDMESDLVSDPIQTEERKQEISNFVRRAILTGRRLGSGSERSESQRILSFWFAIWQRSSPHMTVEFMPILDEFDEESIPALPPSHSPYVGMRPFQEEEENLFFGRHGLINQICQELEQNSVVLTGVAGSGKSSFLRAGILPKVLRGDDSHSSRRCYLLCPGASPLLRLSQAIQSQKEGMYASDPDWCVVWAKQARERLDPELSINELMAFANWDNDDRILFLVDQWEDLHLVCTDVAERRVFVQCLRLLTERLSQGRMLCAVRDGFGTALAEAWGTTPTYSQFSLQIPTEEELREMILEPARRAHLEFEGNIVHDLVKNVVGESAGLLLLQYFLNELWQRRTHTSLVTQEVYSELGGSCRLALLQKVEELLHRLEADGTQSPDLIAAKHLLWRSVEYREGSGFASNSVTRAEVLQHIAKTTRRAKGLTKNEEAHHIYDLFIEYGILRISEGQEDSDVRVEVSHPVLLRECKSLLLWLRERRGILNLRWRLEEQVNEWLRLKKQGNWLSGIQLFEVERWLESPEAKEVGYAPLLEDYLSLSRHMATLNEDKVKQLADTVKGEMSQHFTYKIKSLRCTCEILDLQGTARLTVEAQGVCVIDRDAILTEIPGRAWCLIDDTNLLEPPHLIPPTSHNVEQDNRKLTLHIRAQDEISTHFRIAIEGGLRLQDDPLAYAYQYVRQNAFCMTSETANVKSTPPGEEFAVFRTPVIADHFEVHLSFPQDYPVEPRAGVYMIKIGGDDNLQTEVPSESAKLHPYRDSGSFILQVDNPIVNFYYGFRWRPPSEKDLPKPAP